MDAAVQSSAAVDLQLLRPASPTLPDPRAVTPPERLSFPPRLDPFGSLRTASPPERFPDAPSRHDAAVALVSPAVRVHAHGECLQSDASVFHGRSASSPLLSAADVRFYAEFFLQFDRLFVNYVRALISRACSSTTFVLSCW